MLRYLNFKDYAKEPLLTEIHQFYFFFKQIWIGILQATWGYRKKKSSLQNQNLAFSDKMRSIFYEEDRSGVIHSHPFR